MAAPAPTTDEMTAALSRMSNSLEKARESSDGIVDGFTKLLRTLIPLEAGFKVINALSGNITSSYKDALVTLGHTTEHIIEQRRIEMDRLDNLAKQVQLGKVDVKQHTQALVVFRETERVFQAKYALQKKLTDGMRARLIIGAALLEQAAVALINSHKLNDAVQESNSGFFQRLGLLNIIAKVQQTTGVQVAVAAAAAKSLVRYNLEAKASFADNLKIVIQLHEALGLSTDEAAHLATVVENYARSSFQKVADVMATIVDQTSLAASEVKNLGIEMTRTLGLIQPGAQTTLPGVVQALSGYEGALKEVTGHVGTFQKFISQLATPEGLMAAGMLGVRPEMIKTQAGLDEIMRRFERMTTSIVGQTQGMERAIRLDVVAQTMGLTRYEVNEMVRAMEVRRSQMVKELTLQERFNQQTLNLDQGFSRLMHTLSGLLQQGLYPLVRTLSATINALAFVAQKFALIPGISIAAMVGVTIGVGILAKQLWSVGKAFMEVALAVKLATSELRKHALQQVTSLALQKATSSAAAYANAAAAVAAAGGTQRAAAAAGRAAAAAGGAAAVAKAGFAAAARTSLVAALRTMLIGAVSLPVGVALATIGAGVAYLGYKAHDTYKVLKDVKEDAERTRQRVVESSYSIEAQRRHKMYNLARYGGGDALNQLDLLMQTMRVRMVEEKKSEPEIREALTAANEEFKKELFRAHYASTVFGDNSFMQGKFDKGDQQKAVENTMKDVAGILTKQLQLSQERAKDTKQMKQEDDEKENGLFHKRFFQFGPMMQY